MDVSSYCLWLFVKRNRIHPLPPISTKADVEAQMSSCFSMKKASIFAALLLYSLNIDVELFIKADSKLERTAFTREFQHPTCDLEQVGEANLASI